MNWENVFSNIRESLGKIFGAEKFGEDLSPAEVSENLAELVENASQQSTDTQNAIRENASAIEAISDQLIELEARITANTNAVNEATNTFTDKLNEIVEATKDTGSTLETALNDFKTQVGNELNKIKTVDKTDIDEADSAITSTPTEAKTKDTVTVKINSNELFTGGGVLNSFNS